jgi:hypothetical protein
MILVDKPGPDRVCREGRTTHRSIVRQLSLQVANHLRVEFPLEAFDGLLVEFAAQHGASVGVRRLRTTDNLSNELAMAVTNRGMNPDLQVLFLPASPELAHRDSARSWPNIARLLAGLGGILQPASSASRGRARQGVEDAIERDGAGQPSEAGLLP